MRWRALTALLCVVLLAVGALATLAGSDEPARDRSLQHVAAQQLDDLSSEERSAAAGSELDERGFASHLPVLSVSTQAQGLAGEATLDVFDARGRANRLTDDPTLTTGCRLSSEKDAEGADGKVSYLLGLVDPAGADGAQGLLGMDPAVSWRLDGMEGDDTRMRSYLSLALASGVTEDFVPDACYCELFLDGEYRGLYLLEETPTVGQGRISLATGGDDEAKPGYVVETGGSRDQGEQIVDFLAYTLRSGSPLTVTYPQADALTEERVDFIRGDVDAIEKALYSYDYDTARYGYWRYLDVDSFVSGYVLNELLSNEGFPSDAAFLYKDVEGKLVLGPSLDYDGAIGDGAEGFRLVEHPWYYMLLKDETFCDEVIGSYRSLREGALSDDSLAALVDGTSSYLAPALARDRSRWAEGAGQDAGTQAEDAGNDAAALRERLLARAAWLDRYIDNLRQYSHESMVKKFNH